LAADHLGVAIQVAEHDSVEDARTVMAIYKKIRLQWEVFENLIASASVQLAA